MVKIPGRAAAIVIVSGTVIATAPLTTTCGRLLGCKSNGNCALICPSLEKNRGASTPATLSEAPARLVGNGRVEASRNEVPSLRPNTETMLPGATAPPLS